MDIECQKIQTIRKTVQRRYKMHYIGNELQHRMTLLGITETELSEITFLDEDLIRKVLNNTVVQEEIEEFDFDLICSALHCDTKYFTDAAIREKDLLFSTSNSKDTAKSNKIKANIQQFLQDYTFINSIISE